MKSKRRESILKGTVLLSAVAALIVMTGCGSTEDAAANAAQSADAAASGSGHTGYTESAEPSVLSPAGSTEQAGPVQEASDQAETESEGEEEMNITITAGGHTIKAVLYDNAAARQLYNSLPVTYPTMNLYGREMCYRMGAGSLPTDEAADTGYEIGDISYWPPAGSLVILYKQNGEVFEQQPIGHTDDDISFFDGMDDTDITWERDE